MVLGYTGLANAQVFEGRYKYVCLMYFLKPVSIKVLKNILDIKLRFIYFLFSLIASDFKKPIFYWI